MSIEATVTLGEKKKKKKKKEFIIMGQMPLYPDKRRNDSRYWQS